MTRLTILEAKDAAKEALLAKPNVFSIGIGKKRKGGVLTDELAIVCRVSTKMSPSMLNRSEQIPSKIEGFSTDVIQKTMPSKLEVVNNESLYSPSGSVQLADRISRWRPAPGGVSIGHKDITAGTLGCWVKFNREGQPNSVGILSNHHVLVGDSGMIGDLIVQPGPYDIGGAILPEHHIGHLDSFVPIFFEGAVEPTPCPVAISYVRWGNRIARMLRSKSRIPPAVLQRQSTQNLVDAAIAVPKTPLEDYVEPKILEIGYIHGIRKVTIGDIGRGIQKSGRTTGYTVGSIEEIDVSVRVNYGSGRIALMEDQIMAGGMSAGGDSGSLGVVSTAETQAFGLLFAGSEDSTVFCRIEHVMELLNVTAIMKGTV